MQNKLESEEVKRALVGNQLKDENDILIFSLAPHFKSLHLDNDRKSSLSLILFERADKAWWNPQFDSKALEDQFWRTNLPQVCVKLKYALLYVILLILIWNAYFLAISTFYWMPLTIGCQCLVCLTIIMICLCHTELFAKYHLYVSVIYSFILCTSTLSLYFTFVTTNTWPPISSQGIFSITVEVLLLIYAVIPIQFYMCFIVTAIYSFLSEFLYYFYLNSFIKSSTLILRIFLHICIHIIGIHMLIMSEVRTRETFLKVSQSIMRRNELEMEKRLKEKMIHSVMPPKVADWLMSERHIDEENEILKYPGYKNSSPRSSNPSDIKSIFRPFNMNHMDNVSILFADIVGFTQMSSNKTAEQLVDLLSDLFGRFDNLCVKNGCEKISTLGDCYYCVSGCPEPKSDHAHCCVEMGLDMIIAIKSFDEDKNEQVNMRVGIHTGRVLCGIVGTKRFKFDVFSNDVTMANKMESTGKPGKIHISEKTYQFLKEEYFVEKGENLEGIKTFFILGKKNGAEKEPGIMNEREYLRMKKISNYKYSSKEQTLTDNTQLNCVNTTVQFSAKNGCFNNMGTGEPILDESTLFNSVHIESHCHNEKSQKQSDIQMVHCIQQDTTHRDYFLHPPLGTITLFFTDPQMEQNYQLHGHLQTSSVEAIPTLTSPKLNLLFDLLVSTAVYVVITLSCIINFYPSPAYAIVLSVIGFCLLALLLCLCIQEVLGYWVDCLHYVYDWCIRWYPGHAITALLLIVPNAVLYSHWNCIYVFDQYLYFELFYVTIVHFCNFTRFNSWMKNILAGIAGVIIVCFVITRMCFPSILNNASSLFNNTYFNQESNFSYDDPIFYEIILDVVLLLCLVFLLNRQFDIECRLTFHGGVVAARDRANVQSLKRQADWLLNNIIPEHVMNDLKTKARYSQNHHDVGVMFASVVNFNQLYDESYMGGREYLRVLNELIGDFDDLLDQPQFANVEKIKTIGSTLMVASGLNTELRTLNTDPHQHLFELMDFGFALLDVVNGFNKDLIEFNFIVQIGYNYGDLTSGVIGTTKLSYDIWGDTVNIASRMYSTGIPNRIQCTEYCISVLGKVYDFEPRGMVYVKGKDNMNVYLARGKKK